jgi:hypothetical protein
MQDATEKPIVLHRGCVILVNYLRLATHWVVDGESRENWLSPAEAYDPVGSLFQPLKLLLTAVPWPWIRLAVCLIGVS